MKTIFLFLLLTALALGEVTRTIPIKHDECEEIRSLLKTLVPDANVSVDADSLVIQGSEAAVQQAIELLDRIDRLRNPITFECQLAVVPSLKVQWNENPPSGTITQEVYPPRWFSTFGSFQTFQPVVGKALEPPQNHRILASPRVPGYENQPGWIHLGFEFPLLLQHDLFGLTAEITPTLQPNGEISCQISARYRSLQELIPHRWHRTRTHHLNLHTNLKPGETLVLGRLWDDQDRAGFESIPWIQRTMAYSSHPQPLNDNTYLFITPRLEIQK